MPVWDGALTLPDGAHGAPPCLSGHHASSSAPVRGDRHDTDHRRPAPGSVRGARRLIALLSPGDIIEGAVVRLEEYGAFIEVPLYPEDPDNDQVVTGLCHVSEVDRDYVENIFAYLAEGQRLEVKVLNIKEDGKVDLSIKQADPEWEDEPQAPRRSKIDKDFDKRLRRFMHSSQMIQGEARRQREGRR